PTVADATYTLPAVASTVAAVAGVLATASDPYRYPLTATPVDGPAHGTLALNADGSFTYTPTPRFTGTDQFSFPPADGRNQSAPATVTLHVLDQPPSVDTTGAGYSYAVQPGGGTSWTAAAGVLSRASDPYGYPLTTRLVQNSSPGPYHGTLTLNADG